MKSVLLTALALAIPATATAQSVAVATTSGGRGSHSSVSLTVGLNQSATFNRIRVRPVAVVEDSRCPREVSCVWAGRLVVRLDVAGGPPLTIESGKPVPFGGGTLTLVGAQPVSARGEAHPPHAYRFQLRYQR